MGIRWSICSQLCKGRSNRLSSILFNLYVTKYYYTINYFVKLCRILQINWLLFQGIYLNKILKYINDYNTCKSAFVTPQVHSEPMWALLVNTKTKGHIYTFKYFLFQFHKKKLKIVALNILHRYVSLNSSSQILCLIMQ